MRQQLNKQMQLRVNNRDFISYHYFVYKFGILIVLLYVLMSTPMSPDKHTIIRIS